MQDECPASPQPVSIWGLHSKIISAAGWGFFCFVAWILICYVLPVAKEHSQLRISFTDRLTPRFFATGAACLLGSLICAFFVQRLSSILLLMLIPVAAGAYLSLYLTPTDRSSPWLEFFLHLGATLSGLVLVGGFIRLVLPQERCRVQRLAALLIYPILGEIGHLCWELRWYPPIDWVSFLSTPGMVLHLVSRMPIGLAAVPPLEAFRRKH